MSATLSAPLPAAEPRSSTARDVLAGALAGQIAGLVMAVVVMAVFTFVLGQGPLFPVQVIGSFVFGDAALDGVHGGAIVAGLLLHQLGPALFWGLVFGALVSRMELRGSRLVFAGVAVGVASQVVDVHLILPFLMKALHGHDLWAEHVPVLWSWAAHIVYGLALASFPWVVGRLDRRL